jgi:hypothetical protein
MRGTLLGSHLPHRQPAGVNLLLHGQQLFLPAFLSSFPCVLHAARLLFSLLLAVGPRWSARSGTSQAASLPLDQR